ncbi:MAG: hypothetical protein ACYC0M_09685 [Burkholderiales bacterium]
MCQKLPKCLFCEKLFRADRRNAKHQKYCSEPDCRKASKAASQRAWLAKSDNQDYFSGPENVARVQAWREIHPGYWRRPVEQRLAELDALQDVLMAQPVETTQDSVNLNQVALQDLLSSQQAVLIGFIAHFTGSALQDDIVRSTRHLVKLGQDILTGRVGNDHQTGNLHRASP